MAQEMLEWTVHPLRRHPLKGVLLLLVLLSVEYFLIFVWASPYFALFAAFVLVAATGRFLFPTHYRLDPRGVEARFLGSRRFRPWQGLRRMRRAREGVLLTPFRRRSILDEPRGIFLMFDEEEPAPEAIVAFVERHLADRRPRQGDEETDHG